MDFLTKCAPNAYRNLVAPTYSSSNARGRTRNYGGTTFHHQVSLSYKYYVAVYKLCVCRTFVISKCFFSEVFVDILTYLPF